jgi:hypothetical protein
MTYINNIEIIIRNLVDKEVKKGIDNLKLTYPSAFLEGGICKKGGLQDSFGARFIIDNKGVGSHVLRKIYEIRLYSGYMFFRLYCIGLLVAVL